MIARTVRRHVDTLVSGLAYGTGLVLGALAAIYLWHVLNLPVEWVFAIQK